MIAKKCPVSFTRLGNVVIWPTYPLLLLILCSLLAATYIYSIDIVNIIPFKYVSKQTEDESYICSNFAQKP